MCVFTVCLCVVFHVIMRKLLNSVLEVEILKLTVSVASQLLTFTWLCVNF